jgi:cyanophycinase
VVCSEGEENVPGILMPIGGAEDRRSDRVILKRFVELCGSSNARIVVIPSASGFPHETAKTYKSLFSDLGAGSVFEFHVNSRQQANDPASIQLLNDVTGIFFTGGDQLRLLSLIGATRFAQSIRSHHLNGIHIAGTSAGASALSLQMIAFGRSGTVPSQRMVQIAAGLGLTESLIIDQHFSQRNRLGRLMTAVALNPHRIGIGVDEDTALMIAPDGCCEVIGAGSVTVVDGRQLEYSDIYAAKRYEPFTLTGVHVQKLRTGMQIHLAC